MERLDKNTITVMGHLVLGYPTLAESIRTAEKYVEGGVAILELQIPFSHPTADGPVITAACQEAVERQHVSLSDCLGALQTIRNKYPQQEIMVMSYVNRVYAYGLKKFTEAMENLQIHHLIIPDLPVDDPHSSLIIHHSSLKLVPVLAANVSDTRLEKLLAMGFDFFYLMSDFKITGSTFSLHPRLQRVIERIKQHSPDIRIGIGFGISTPEQARSVADAADVAIIGSALIQAQQKGVLEKYLQEMIEIN
ncbi:MAG TPA: tryptophan synthase subunit alpha [Saprospiraceae bacterium]|nr:tryptophan synthase subunit alpha [Saprospiraceae bacterium]HPI05638.1 tryptophan synthase subunit alpha [Saprospiraceae bacterium]